MTKKQCKILSVFLAILFTIGAFPLNAFAKTISESQGAYVNASYVAVPGASTPGKRNSDGSYNGTAYTYVMANGKTTNLLMMFLKPDNTVNGRDISYAIKDNNGNIMWCYCIEYGKNVSGSSMGTATTPTDSSYWQNLSTSQKQGMTLAQMYGFPANNYGVSNCDAYAATQIIIWEYLMGYRVGDGPVKDGRLLKSIEGTRAEIAYDGIMTAIRKHSQAPSFASDQNIKLTYSSKTGVYSATLTDSNNVLSKFNVSSSDPAIKASISGNKLTITSTKAVSGAGLTFKENIKNAYAQGYMVLENKATQKCIFGQAVDPFITTMRFSTQDVGSIKITKQAEDKVVSGVNFRVTGNGVDATVTTDKDGIAVKDDLLPGTYTVAEINTPSKYYQPDAQTVTISGKQTAEITFNNILKPGAIRIENRTDDYKNISYTVSSNGKDYNVVTDAYGKVTIPDLKPGYYLVVQDNSKEEQYVKVNAEQTTVVVFDDSNKFGDVEVEVVSEDGENSDVELLLLGLSSMNNFIVLYDVTDENGIVKFEGIPISGKNGVYYICEEYPEERYVSNGNPFSTKDPLKDEYIFAVEYNKTTHIVYERRLKKFRANISVGINTNLGDYAGDIDYSGAVYGLYNGDTLVESHETDINGYFTTDYHPCGGNWSIRQITPPKNCLPDDTIYKIDTDYGKFTEEYNEIKGYIDEELAAGGIALTAILTDYEHSSEAPECNAEFQVYLKSAGSYDNAKYGEACDLDTSFAWFGMYYTTVALPYGTYIVHQVSGTEGFYLAEDFEIVISENKMYECSVTNEPLPIIEYTVIIPEYIEVGGSTQAVTAQDVFFSHNQELQITANYDGILTNIENMDDTLEYDFFSNNAKTESGDVIMRTGKETDSVSINAKLKDKARFSGMYVSTINFFIEVV